MRINSISNRPSNLRGSAYHSLATSAPSRVLASALFSVGLLASSSAMAQVKDATITVCKATLPSPPFAGDQFSFGFTGDLGPFSLTDDQCTEPFGVLADSVLEYDVIETDPTGFTLTGLNCPGASWTRVGNTVTVVPDPGEAVVCTFTNTEHRTLTLVKEIVNDNGGTAVVSDFSITTDAGAVTFDGGTTLVDTTTYTSTPISVPGGTYSLQEIDVAGYTEGSWRCTVGTGLVSTFNAGSITLLVGESTTCTITNDDEDLIFKNSFEDAAGQ